MVSVLSQRGFVRGLLLIALCIPRTTADACGELPCTTSTSIDNDPPPTCTAIYSGGGSGQVGVLGNAAPCVCIANHYMDDSGDCVHPCASKSCYGTPFPKGCNDRSKICQCTDESHTLVGEVCQDACGVLPCTTSRAIDRVTTPTCTATGPDCDCIPNHYMDGSGDCIHPCHRKPCYNAASPANCIDDDFNTCICPTAAYGFTANGQYCTNACSGAECEDVGNCVTINGDCSCQDDLVFDEDRACVDPCTGKTCFTEGDCRNVEGICSCTSPLVFDDTEELCVDNCYNKPCQAMDTPTCSIINNVCKCKPGLHFDDADNCVDDCAGLPCDPKSLCFASSRTFKCECIPGYRFTRTLECKDACYGKQCLIDGDCRFSTDSLMCECDVGKVMNENDECVDNCEEKPCFRANSCSLDNNGDCMCNGPLRFNEDFDCVDVCVDFPCFPLRCSESGGRCVCKDGYTLDANYNCVDDCAGKLCEIEGNCEVEANTRKCSCDTGLDLNDSGKCVLSLGVIVGAVVGGFLVLLITAVGIILCIRLRAPRVSVQPPTLRSPYGQPFRFPVGRRFVPSPYAGFRG